MLRLLKGIYQIFRCIRELVLSIFFILFVLVCFALTALLATDPQGQKREIPFEKGALTLNLDGYLADNHDEFGDFNRFIRSELGGSDEPMKISTFDVVRAINKARKDEKITGLVLDLTYFTGGDIPSLSFVGNEIERFKQSGKPVIAIGEAYSQKQYYLASYADKIYLNKAGFVDLHGLSYSNLYFKSLLDKIEAVPHIFRVGTYKSAVEPFLRDDMSPEAKENAQLWLNKLWAKFSEEIAKNRGIQAKDIVPEPSRLLQQYKEIKGDDAQYALKQNWVTELSTYKQIREMLIAQFGEDIDGNYNSIDFLDYSATLSDRFDVSGENKIAVINVEGAIVLGESDEEVAGSDTIIKLLRDAREDTNVDGVILRINSPGGSAMASELIRQEVEDLQQAGKPVVASMGGMAASGGYWIAATSDKIIASPTTLTGSIGIFGLSVSFEKTAKNLGVSEDGIATSPLAQQTALKPLSKEQAEMIQISIEHGYDRFLELVSKGRKMTKTEVDKVAQGQVWLGETALEKGLVDELGDFNTAYVAVSELINQKRKAEGKSEIQGFKTQWFIDEPSDLLGQVMRDFKLNMKVKLISWLELPFSQQTKQQLGTLSRFNDPKQSYLYCLNCGTVN
ncbi:MULTISPECIES: signal peptide peptidase SppA [Glaesserella]|uniref:Signal peptide peptidase SppA n=1 Tax=Glaesserella australis TaxID=2094024 RepID=A0A328BYL2_9PAST|nr:MULTISPECIES: signal peptide peptidase SppA [Glaesserella]AUI66147.1 signal peptide peptidase SppA [Glaesserella sp. 15-184]RAL19169.1 signal peptide peptidase SppA [Glaesserella australis]